MNFQINIAISDYDCDWRFKVLNNIELLLICFSLILVSGCYYD